MSALTGLALAACGATGVALLVDPLIGSPISRSLRVEPAALGAAARQRLNQAGLADVSITQLVAMSANAAAGAAWRRTWPISASTTGKVWASTKANSRRTPAALAAI